jgi:hypothetical protein
VPAVRGLGNTVATPAALRLNRRLLYVEAAAALAQARRMALLTASAHRAALRRLDRLWEQVQIAEVDQIVVQQAVALANRFDLRGYDAMHCEPRRSWLSKTSSPLSVTDGCSMSGPNSVSPPLIPTPRPRAANRCRGFRCLER